MRYLRWSRVVPKEGRHVMLALQTQDCLPLLVSPYAIVASVQLFRVSHLPDNSRPPGPPRASTLGKAEAITKTQARRPRYRMTGIATLTGRFSSAVGTTHDASKVIPCIVILLLAAKPPSPEVVHDRAPVPPGRASWYDHIDSNRPTMFRITSACQLPASRLPPPVQARKGGRLD